MISLKRGKNNMPGYLEFITEAELVKIIDQHKRKSQSFFPGLIKRLIDETCEDVQYLRAPSANEIHQHGYDVIVKNRKTAKYVPKGVSVWELGTDVDAIKKIKRDLEKRSRDPLCAKQDETTFLLCTPRTAPEAQKADLINNRAGRMAKWKDVLIYDSCIICDWINQSPITCTWLIKKFIDNKFRNFETIENAWENLSSKTSPKLTASFFSYDVPQISKDDIENNSYLIVEADNDIDSYGYTLTSLMRMKKSNVLIVNDEDSLKILLSIASNHIFITRLKPKDLPLKNNNKIISCLSREHGYGKNVTIKLPKRNPENTRNALLEMGVDNVKAYRICDATHSSTYPIIRRISSNNPPTEKEWTRRDDKSIIERLLFIQHFINDSEKKVLEKLTGIEKIRLEDKLKEISIINDSPIQKYSNGYIISSPYEIIDACNITSDSSSYKNANSLLFEIISSIMNHNSWENIPANQIRDDGILPRLARGYIYASYDDNSQFNISNDIDKLLQTDIIIEKGEIALDIFPILSEAAPKILLNYIEQNKESVERLAISNFNSYLFIEESLKIIAEDGYLAEVCNLFIFLNKDFKKTSYYNTPLNALKDLLSIWDEKGINTPDDKIGNIKNIFQRNPKLAIDLVIEIVNERGYIATQRIKEKDYTRDKLTYGTMWEYYKKIIGIILSDSQNYRLVELIEAIIHNLDLLEPLSIEKILDLIDLNLLSDSDAAIISTEIEFRKKSTKNNKTILYALNTFEAKLQRKVAIEKPWLFTEFFNTPINYEDKRIKNRENYINRQRKEHFKRLKQKSKYIEQISKIISNEYYWGIFIVKNDKENIHKYIEPLSSQGKLNVISGIVDGVSKAMRKDIFSEIKPENRQTIIKTCQSDIDQYITKNEEKIYWENKILRKYSKHRYKMMLLYNPIGLIPYIYTNNETPLDIILETFGAINNSKKTDNNIFNVKYELLEIIKRFEHQENNKLDEAVSKLLINGYIDKATEQCNRYFTKNVKAIETLRDARDRFLVYNLFELKLPRNAYAEKGKIGNILSPILNKESDSSIVIVLLRNSLFSAKSESEEKQILQYIESVNKRDELIKKLSIENGLIMYSGNDNDGNDSKTRYAEKYEKYKDAYPNASRIYKTLSEKRKNDMNHLKMFGEIHEIESDQSVI